jgi:AmmeMemoRadiSam system protein B
MKAMKIRPPTVAGLFYPADPTLLGLEVDRMIEEYDVPSSGSSPVALIVPHAGYAYSGRTAAAAYARLRGRPLRTAVIVSPSHREYFNGISVYDGDAYRTPLGLVNIDVQLRDALLARRGIIRCSALGHRDEHAVEVHLPFLQRINPHVKILPVVMGDQRGEYCSVLGEALAELASDPGIVLIASSDLSHFHVDQEARELDEIAAKDVRDVSPVRLLRDIASRTAEACGGGPMAAVMIAAARLGASDGTVFHQCNSGDVTGDRDRVVGYLSAGFYTDSGGAS